jgi:pSer/pThr/pTyr-binding forkhead associated (FHA) protein
MASLIIEKSQKAELIGQQFELLENGAALRIGRDASNDVALDDQRSSKKHCRIYLQDGDWYLEDGGSRNGTILRGDKIKKIAIGGDARFQVGSSLLHFRADEHLDRFQGKEVHGCRLEKLLGASGGVLRYHARQLALDRGIRLDIIHPSWPCLAERNEILESHVTKLERDLGSGAQIRHPNIAQVLRHTIPDERGGGLVLVKLSGMTSLGDSLSHLLAADQSARLKFLSMLADALCARSEFESLNTPFGLGDIGFDNRGCPWIPAFELSSWLATVRGHGRTLPGLVPYLPPEMIAKLDGTEAPPEYTFASMAYNFGAVAYHVLTGKAPMGDGLGAETLRNHLKLASAPANLLAPGVPEEIVALLDRFLKKNPAERPASREEIVAPFEKATAALQASAAPSAAAPSNVPEAGSDAHLDDDLDDDDDDDDWDVMPEVTPAAVVPSTTVAPGTSPRETEAARARKVGSPFEETGLDFRTLPMWIAFWILLFFVTKYGVQFALETTLKN